MKYNNSAYKIVSFLLVAIGVDTVQSMKISVICHSK